MKVSDLSQQAVQFKSLKKEPRPAEERDPKLMDSARKLEGLFVGYMLKAMEQTIPKDADSKSNSLASMMFSTVMGEDIARKGGIGLTDFIYNALKENGQKELPQLPADLTDISMYNLNLGSSNGSDD